MKLYTKPTLRKTIELDTDLYDTIEAMAKEKGWSFSYMSYILLQYAIKEKHRKKKNSSQNNTGHLGQSDRQ